MASGAAENLGLVLAEKHPQRQPQRHAQLSELGCEANDDDRVAPAHPALSPVALDGQPGRS